MIKHPCVYIVANKRNGTLYTGVTSNLLKRIYQHKKGLIKGFSLKYKTNILVWYEFYETMDNAIKREKNIKFWKRQWKIALIERSNSNWNDLYNDLNEYPFGKIYI